MKASDFQTETITNFGFDEPAVYTPLGNNEGAKLNINGKVLALFQSDSELQVSIDNGDTVTLSEGESHKSSGILVTSGSAIVESDVVCSAPGSTVGRVACW